MEKVLRLYKYIDGINDIAFPNEKEQAIITSFRYDAKRMGAAPTISFSLMHSSCLDSLWDNKVYALFNGERFYVKQTPTSSYSSSDTRYKHEVELVSERFILDNIYFYDVVSSSSQDKPVSNSSKFSFFGNIKEYVSRLNNSLNKSNVGYSVVIDDDILSDEELMSIESKVTFEDQVITNALQEIYNVYKIPYYFVGKTIHVGYYQDNIDTVFKYGCKNSLISISKTNANSKIINKITGVGSSDNIPYYYPNVDEKGITQVLCNGREGIATIIDLAKYRKVKLADKFVFHETIQSLVPLIDEDDYSFGDFRDEGVDGNGKQRVSIDFYYSFTLQQYESVEFSVTTTYEDSLDLRYEIFNPSGQYVAYYKEDKMLNLTGGNYQFVIRWSFLSKEPMIGSDDVIKNFVSQYLNVKANIVVDSINAWTKNNIPVTLSDYGISVNSPSDGDALTIECLAYIQPQPNLVPPIYRNTEGDERFYEAINGEYKNEKGEYYQFDNEYTSTNPREHIENFDDVKPTIKNVVNDRGEYIDEFIDFAYDLDDNDETDESGKFIHPYFFGKLRRFDGEFGLNLFDHAIDEGEMVVSMTSGTCGSCEFVIGVDEQSQKNIVQVDADGNLVRDNNGNVRRTGTPQDRQNDTKNNEVWIALKKDIQTFGVVMPNVGNNYRPKAGDKFILLHIDLPQQYVEAAENALKDKLIKYMHENNFEKFNFSIAFSRIYFAENPTILANLSENSKIQIEYNNNIYDLYISSLSYSISNDSALPEVKVELEDALSISQNQITQVVESTKREIISSIDKNVFWGDIKGVPTWITSDKPRYSYSELSGRGTSDNSNDVWVVKKDAQGNSYVYTKLDVVVERGVTMYGTDGSVDVSSIFKGIPIDNNTIYWDGEVLKSKGVGEGGVTPTLLGDLTNVGVWANAIAAEDRIMVQKKGGYLWEELPLNSIGCTDKDNNNGLGYKVLHKDIPIDEQVIATNTIYEVRYDFYLNGSLNIPSGCVLKFDGGSINGGSVVFNKTKLVGDVKLYSSISGSLDGGIANIDWFVDDSSSDVTDILNQLLSIVKRVEFCSRTYHVNGTINVPSGKQLIGNGCAISASGSVDLFSIESNARGNIIENMTLYTSYSSSKSGAAIRLNSSNGGADHIYRDLYINEFAYGIYASEVWWGNTVENVKCTMCGHSFVILGTGGQSINNTFIRCYSNNPYVRGITLGAVKSCTFINCNNGCDTGGSFLQVQTNCQGVKFVGCNFEGGLMKNNQYLFNLTSGSIINFDTCTFVKLLKYDSSQNNTIAMRVMNTCQVTLIDCTGLSNEYVNFALAQNDAKVYIRNLNGVGSFVSYNNASVVNMVNYLQKSLWDKSFEFTENNNGNEVLNAKLPIDGYLKSQGYLPEGSVDSTTLGVYSVGGYSPSGAEYTYGTLVALNSVAGCAQLHFTDSRNNLGGQAFFRSAYINGGTETLDAEWTEFITSKNIEKQSVDSANTLSTPRKLWGQDFDGSEDVSGDLSNVGNIIPTTNNTFKIGESANRQWENVFSREVTVDGITIKKSENGVLYIDGTLAVSGGVTSFAVEEEQIANVMDGVVVDETTIIKRGNKLMLNPDITLGGGSSNWTDIAGKPTTISGYGITDAKISNGTITLGNSTITPLTRTTADSLYLGKNESVDMAEKDGNGSVIADTYFKNRGYATSSNIKSTTIGAYSVSGYSPSGADYTYGSVLSFPSSAGLVQMHFTDGRNALGNQLFFRNQYKSGGVSSISSDWVEVITSKNISDFPVEASSLSKTCSIWGQDFDGTGDVDGRLYDVTGINDIDIESNGQVVVPSSEAATMLLKRTKSGGAFIRCYPNNQDSKTWSIGVDNLYNAAWFYVDSSSGVDVRRMYLSSEGNLTITGSLSQGSDVRYKNIHKEIVLPIDFMADAPCFEYDFIDDESCRTHLGTSAQYWESIEGIVSRDNDGRYCMDYSSLGVVMGISIAKEFTAYKKDMDKRMEELCKEMEALRMEVEFLKNK